MSTPTSGGAEKTCVVCGQDVASKPRTKDGRGRYYCQPCYEEAIAQKHAKRAAAPMPKVQPTASFKTLPRHDSGDDGASHILEGLIEQHPAAAPMTMICPACRQNIPANGVICTNCGFNVQTQEHLQPTAVRRAKSPSASAGFIWPVVIGILSILYGLVDGTLQVWNFIDLMDSGNLRLRAGIIPIVLDGCLIYAAIQVMTRNSSGAKLIRQWAYVKTVLGVTCFGLMIVGTATSKGMSGALAERFGLEKDEVDQTVMAIVLAIEFLWYTAWALFVLVWFHRAAIRRQIEEW